MASLTLSIPSSTLSFALSIFSSTSPVRRSVLPWDSRSLSPVRTPAASLAWPLTCSDLALIAHHPYSSTTADSCPCVSGLTGAKVLSPPDPELHRTQQRNPVCSV